MTRVCYATSDTPRAILALGAPFLFLAAFEMVLTLKGYSLADYPALLSSGDVPWFSQAVGWLCLCAWIWRYFPSAWRALWDGPCLIWSEGDDLYIHRNGKVSVASIRSVSVRRGFFRKVAYLERQHGRIAVSLLFVRPSSDALLRSLPSREALPV